MHGTDKLLLKVGATTLIRKAASAALNSKSCDTVVVIQPKQTEKFLSIRDLKLRIHLSSQSYKGIAMSLKSGLSAISKNADGAIILLADMPEIDCNDLNALIDHFQPGKIVAAGANGKIGNPVLLPKSLFAEVAVLNGDKGAKRIINKHLNVVTVINRPGNRASLDIDTLEDWKNWISR